MWITKHMKKVKYLNNFNLFIPHKTRYIRIVNFICALFDFYFTSQFAINLVSFSLLISRVAIKMIYTYIYNIFATFNKNSSCHDTFMQTQEKVIFTDTTKESEQMEQIYEQTLYTYKQQLDDVTEKRAQTIADVQDYEDKVRKMRDENARVLDELLDREREVATGLIYATTGRKITEKAVNEITRRQV